MDGEISVDRSTNFQEFLDEYGIVRTITAVRSHFTLGIAERIVGKCKEAFRKLTFHTHIEWHKIIGMVNSSINKSVLTYNVSAEKVLFGQDLDNIWSPLQFHVAVDDPKEYYEKIKKIIIEAQAVLRRNKDRKARQNIAYANQRTRQKNFKENQIVTYSNLKIEAGRGLTIKNIPCQIITTMKSSAYVKDLISGNYSKQHFSHLHEFQHNEEVELPQNWQELIISQSNNVDQIQSPSSSEILMEPTSVEQQPSSQTVEETLEITPTPETMENTDHTNNIQQQPSTSAITPRDQEPTRTNLGNTIERLLTHINRNTDSNEQ